MLNIPTNKVVYNDAISKSDDYNGLRIVRFQSRETDKDNYANRRYDFQIQTAKYHVLKAVLSRKGFEGKYRIVASIHPNLRAFVDIVKYDPAHPELYVDDFFGTEVREIHVKTQHDFKGQKKQNGLDFANYLLEGISLRRDLYLPTISGWQTTSVFDETIFVAFDESDQNALYGELYLPKKAILQADGQTQTAALFQVARTKQGIESGALDNLIVTLEIELNVDERKAGQSFADRNGRGSNKNKNLVISMDSSSALSQLRLEAISGTVFSGRVADGRSIGATKTNNENIVDLSTMEQMILNAVTNGRYKPEHIKHHHLDFLQPFASEFVKLLHDTFAQQWPEHNKKNVDSYRQIYVHGWPFALKAIAKCYFQSRINKLAPIVSAISEEKTYIDPKKSEPEKFQFLIDSYDGNAPASTVTFEELKSRLSKIDWYRYREHWIKITGYSIQKSGKKKTFKLKPNGEEKVIAQAPNTSAVIDRVTSTILSDKWTGLCSTKDESLM